MAAERSDHTLQATALVPEAYLRLVDDNQAKLRFFAGMTVEEAAESMGIPPRSAYRNWEYARAWIYRRLREDDLSESGEMK